MKCTVVVLLCLLALLVTACSSGNKAGGANGGKTIILTFASQFSGGEPDQLVRFANEVTRRSGGAIRIEFKENWRAHDTHQELDTIRDVRTGKVDLGWVGARAWDWLGVHSFDPLIAPFLIDSYQLEQKVFARGIPQRLLAGVRRAGVVGIGVLPGPMRKVLGVSRRLDSPARFGGMTFGVQGLVAAETFRALGARPQQLFAQAPLTRLGGVESQMSAIANNGYDSTARYLSANVNLWPRPLVIFASPKIFHSLSNSQRQVLREAAVSAVPQAMSASEQEDVGAVHVLCARGKIALVDLTPAQLQSLERAVDPVYRQLRRNTATRRTISRIEALKEPLPGPPPIHCKAASTAAGEAATPIDGTWEMKVTASQLIGNPAYGHPVTLQDVEPDVGTYRFVFEHGRLESSLTQTNGTTRDIGTYRLHGDLVTFHIASGHDIGETDVYRWSLYHDTLTFRRDPHGAQGPPNPTFAPWRRVRAPRARSAAASIDGAWQVRLTQAKLLGNPAYGRPVTAQDVRPDIGTYRLLLHRGHFRVSWSGPSGVSRDSGTYRLRGDVVTFRITGARDVGGGSDLGETWSYRWNVYRGELTFSKPPVAASVGPPNQMFEPWHRVGR